MKWKKKTEIRFVNRDRRCMLYALCREMKKFFFLFLFCFTANVYKQKKPIIVMRTTTQKYKDRSFELKCKIRKFLVSYTLCFPTKQIGIK